MKKYLKLLAVVLTLALAFSVTACGDKEEAAADECWADKYVALIESGEARDFADYDALKAELDKIREECGANYVYALSTLMFISILVLLVLMNIAQSKAEKKGKREAK